MYADEAVTQLNRRLNHPIEFVQRKNNEPRREDPKKAEKYVGWKERKEGISPFNKNFYSVTTGAGRNGRDDCFGVLASPPGFAAWLRQTPNFYLKYCLSTSSVVMMGQPGRRKTSHTENKFKAASPVLPPDPCCSTVPGPNP